MTVDGTVGVVDQNTGGIKTVDTSHITNDEGTIVERQRMSIGDPVAIDNLASVDTSDPADDEAGLVVRIAAKDHEFGQIHELLYMILTTLQDIQASLSNGD